MKVCSLYERERGKSGLWRGKAGKLAYQVGRAMTERQGKKELHFRTGQSVPSEWLGLAFTQAQRSVGLASEPQTCSWAQHVRGSLKLQWISRLSTGVYDGLGGSLRWL